MKMQLVIAVVAAALLASAAPALAIHRYKIFDLGIVPGSANSVARAISSNGMVGGESNVGPLALAISPVLFNGGATQLPNLAGAGNTYVRGINNAGVAAAVVQSTGGNDRAALLSNSGAVQLASISGFNAAGAFDVNNNGIAVGYVLSNGRTNADGSLPLVGNAAGSQRAVIWTDGVATQLASPAGAVNSVAYAITDDGTVTGMYRSTNNQVHGVVWKNGVPTTLALPSGQSSARTRAISEAGWVAGQTFGALGGMATVWTPSGALLLPHLLPGFDVQDIARGINSEGTVVGFSNTFDVDGNLQSSSVMLWEYSATGYVAFDLAHLINNLGTWDFSVASGQAINDKGDIVGLADVSVGGPPHAFLLTAVPEPASWAMMIGGFGMIGGALRRRRFAVA